MKNLKDVLEKLRVDDIVLGEKFPTSEDLKDVIEFLKKEGFKEYKIDKTGVIGTLNKNKGKIFLLKENNNRLLWFADTSKVKISERNPVFFLIKYGNMRMEWRYFGEDYETISADKNKVIDLLNKRFGWQ